MLVYQRVTPNFHTVQPADGLERRAKRRGRCFQVRRKGETKTVLQTLTQEGVPWEGRSGDPLEVFMGDFNGTILIRIFWWDILMGYFNGIC